MECVVTFNLCQIFLMHLYHQHFISLSLEQMKLQIALTSFHEIFEAVYF